MLQGLDVSGWTGMPKVRAAFRAEGFGVPDTFARLAAELCDGAFTVEAFLADDARHFLKTLSGQPQVPPFEDGTPKRILMDRWRLDSEINEVQMHEPLMLARIAELERAGEGVEPQLRKAVEIRDYAESFGKQIGFVPKRNKDAHGYQKRTLAKKMPRTGLLGYFAVDAGGRSSLAMGPGGRPVFYGGRVGLNFGLGFVNSGQDNGFIWPANMIGGLTEYDKVEDTRGRRVANGFVQPCELELITKTASWGARAQLRFFDILLSQLDADLAPRSEGGV